MKRFLLLVLLILAGFQSERAEALVPRYVGYLFPYLADKSKWPLKPDIQAWGGWPARQPSLLFAGLAFYTKPYLDLWQKLPPDPADPEIQRNIAIIQPLIWLEER